MEDWVIKILTKAPQGWVVLELGQEPIFGLWYCSLFNIDTRQVVSVEEKDSLYQAFKAAKKLTKGK